MATRIAHGSTTAATVATVTLNGYYSYVQIDNRGGDDLFASMDGSTNPTVSGDDFWVIPQNQSRVLKNVANPQWEPGMKAHITTTASQAIGSGVTLNILPATQSFPVGAVFTFANTGTFTTTAVIKAGDITATGNVATANLLANVDGTLGGPSTTVIKIISTAVCKYSLTGISL